jgi:hypothetical protein
MYDFGFAFCLLLLAELIVYPGTQLSYGVLLIVPILVETYHRLVEHASVLRMLTVFGTIYAVASSSVFLGCVLLRLVFLYGFARNLYGIREDSSSSNLRQADLRG